MRNLLHASEETNLDLFTHATPRLSLRQAHFQGPGSARVTDVMLLYVFLYIPLAANMGTCGSLRLPPE